MYVFEFIIVIIEIAILMFYCTLIFDKKTVPSSVRIITVAAAITLVTLSSIFRLGTAINLIIGYLLFLAITQVIFVSTLKKRLFIGAIFIVIIIFSDILAAIIMTISGIAYGMMGGDDITYITGAMLSCFIRLWLSAYVGKILSKRIHDLPLLYWIFLFICPILSVACMVIFDIYLMQTQQVSTILVFIPLFCILYMNFMLFYFFETFSEQIRLKVIERLAESEAENYKLLQENETELRTLRHDIKNHIMMINEYLQRNDTQTALCHLSDIQHTLEELSVLVYTNNPSIDAAVNIGARKAQAENIEYKVQIIGNILVNIEAGDICRLLSNAIDNAIESAVKCKTGYIYIEININNDVINIHIENSTSSSSVNLVTSKADKKNHGLGMKNIKNVVKKYNGIMDTKITDGVFNLDIALQNSTQFDGI